MQVKKQMVEPNIELSIDPEQALFILMKSKGLAAKTAASVADQGSNPIDDAAVEILEDRPGDPTHAELLSAIQSLDSDAQHDLVTLMWVGRGDFDIADWWAARRQAAEDTESMDIPRYLVQIPLLSSYLEDALARLGYSVHEQKSDRL